MSLGNAVTASPLGPMAIHYNPAGLSKVKDGFTVSKSAIFIDDDTRVHLTPDPGFSILNDTWGTNAEPDPDDPYGSYSQGPDPLAGTTAKAQSAVYVPFLDKTTTQMIHSTTGIAYHKPGSPYTLAFGIYEPFSFGVRHEQIDNPLRYAAQESIINHLIYAAPSVSFAITNELSLGASLGFGQTYRGLYWHIRYPNEILALTRVLGDATSTGDSSGQAADFFINTENQEDLSRPYFGGGIGPYDTTAAIKMELTDNYSPSINFGLLYEPLNWLSFGIVYQSSIKATLLGKYSLKYSDQMRKYIDWNSFL